MGIDLRDIDAQLEAFDVPEARLRQVRRDALAKVPTDVDGVEAMLHELAEGLELRSLEDGGVGVPPSSGGSVPPPPPAEDGAGSDAALDEVLDLDSMELESVELDSVELEAAELTSAELGSLEGELSGGQED